MKLWLYLITNENYNQHIKNAMTIEQLQKATEIYLLIQKLESLKGLVSTSINESKDSLYLLSNIDTNYKDKFDQLNERFIILIDAKIQALNAEIEQL